MVDEFFLFRRATITGQRLDSAIADAAADWILSRSEIAAPLLAPFGLLQLRAINGGGNWEPPIYDTSNSGSN